MRKIVLLLVTINLFTLSYSQINFTKVRQDVESDLKVVDIGDINNDGLDDVIVGAGYMFDNINSYKQIDDILQDFMKKTYSNNILKIKNSIGFFDFDQDKAENDEKYDYYELFVKIEFLKEFIKARYILNKSGKVENFELSFK